LNHFLRDLAEKVEKTRDRMVTVVERQADGTVERRMKRVTLRQADKE
jgi:hypothetical protein